MNLQTFYKKEVIPEMKKQFGYTADLAVPKITKISINVGLSKAARDSHFREAVEQSLARIAGQKPAITKARHSIAGFGIREGLIIGEKVTMRGKRMYDFFGKLIHVVMPRIRDFQGMNTKSIDKNANYTLGLKENTIFPEINPEEMSVIHGMEITIVTNAKKKEEAEALLRLFSFPFKKSHNIWQKNQK